MCLLHPIMLARQLSVMLASVAPLELRLSFAELLSWVFLPKVYNFSCQYFFFLDSLAANYYYPYNSACICVVLILES